MSNPTSHASTTFDSFGLDARIEACLKKQGFETPTPIQAEAIPLLLAGRDVIGRSRTGSGKTAAFALPALERIKDGAKGPRVLVLTPTRELALQVAEAVRTFARDLPIRLACIYGGASYTPQLRDLRSGAQFIVATPGRLIDHMERGSIDLSGIETLVLDEADEMLRMGFIEAVEEVMEATPAGRQVCLFSATMPAVIRRVADKHLPDPVEVQVESEGLSASHIQQKWILVPPREKVDTLVRLLNTEARGTTLVFARTRRDCGETADQLGRRGFKAEALHGALNQAARERVLQRMRSGRVDVVIATDVAARGIDVEHITHVINLHLPTDVETYVHRIGRTGRAGREGTAISLASHGERRRIHGFERALKVQIAPMQPPTDRDVALRKRAELKRRMSESLTGDLGDIRTWLEELRQEGWSDADVAAATMLLLNKSERLGLGRLPDKQAAPIVYDAPEPREHRKGDRKSDPRGRQQRPGFDEVNEVQLMLFTGSEFRVRPGDLVGALANELNIPGNRIGRVNIRDRKSFVGLPRAIAEKALAERNSLPVRGRPVRIAMARPQHEGPSRGGPRSEGPPRGGPRGGDQPFKGKPKGKFKGKGKSKFKAKGALKGKRRGSARGAQAAA